MSQHQHLKFAPTHEWACLNPDGQVEVGISHHAQEALGDLVYVELPEVGRQLKAGEACAVVESVKTASDVHSPVKGTVVAVNQALTKTPELVNEDAWKHSLFTVLPDNPSDLDVLLDEAAYQQQIEES